MATLVVVIVLLLVAAAALYAFVLLLAHKTAFPRKKKTIDYELISPEAVAVDRSLATELPGEYGLWTANGAGHVLVGDILDDTAAGSITRAVVAATGDVPRVGSGRWSSHIYAGPEATGLPHRDVSITGPRGSREAWLFPGDASVWAIHIHGINTSRASVLRTVPVFSRLGASSLVPSYYADGDNQDPAHPLPTTFGIWESDDVDAAIAYAVENGAKSILLVGWSMGATIALRLVERSKHADLIEGLVLISPATNWRAVIVAGIRGAGIPSWLARLVPLALASRLGSRLAGVPIPIPFAELDWCTPNRTLSSRSLIIHSPGDGDVPFELTTALSKANPGRVSLEQFPSVPHQFEYNQNPARFERAIETWLSQTRK